MVGTHKKAWKTGLVMGIGFHGFHGNVIGFYGNILA